MCKECFEVINPPERRRVYVFPNNEIVLLENVTALAVSENGTHYVETEDGEHHVINKGWLEIDLDIDDWAFI